MRRCDPVGKRSTDAKVVATEGQFIWLDLSKQFGDRIPQAFYDVDLSFLLKDLKEKYSIFKENPDQIRRPGLNLILGTIQDTPVSSFSPSHSLNFLLESKYSH